MLPGFSEILEQHGLSAAAEPVLAAVSGGIDSMCMADLLLHSGIRFSVAHCNFHLRGDDSDADEALVRDWAARNGIKFHKTDFDTEEFAAAHGVSVEMAARELRYRWFAETCISSGYGALCVAHNANDNAETLFLNLVRGTGLKGISGMSVESVVPYSDGKSPIRLLRPLLPFTRKQIEGYVRSHSVPFREDRTNAMTDYRRNRIRHLVFPVFEKMNPSFICTVNDEMSYFAQAGAIAEAFYEDEIRKCISSEGSDIVLSVRKLTAVRHWEYLLYRFMDSYGFNRGAVNSLVRMLKSGGTFSGKRLDAPGYVLLTASDRVIVRPVAISGKSSAMTAWQTDQDMFTAVRGCGIYSCNGMTFSVSLADRSQITSLRQPHGTLLFDASRLTFPFACRNWRDGDWFVPFGMKGRKKVSDFFTDLKYDIFRKKAAVMVVDTSSLDSGNGRVAAILGERIDDRYRVSSDTASVLVLTIIT